MSKTLKATIIFVVILVVAQLVRPDHANPPIDASRTIQAHAGIVRAVPAILDRSCGTCHSNATPWPWYSQVAPLSWVYAGMVRKGRKAVNFSEWAAYQPDEQRELMTLACDDVKDGTMPGLYTKVNPEARLSAQDIATICSAAVAIQPPSTPASTATTAQQPGVTRAR